MKKGCLIGLGFAGLFLFFLLVIGVLFGIYYNKIVTLHEAIEARWAQVENQLQRRFDLIPSLVNTVKGYAKHEKEIFTYIADARARLAGAKTIPQKIQASRFLEGALSRLLVIVERYPDLKASQTFTRLMDELAGTENRLSVERMRYNEAVRRYTTLIRRFPGRIFAAIFGFEPATYFHVEEEVKEVPKVEF
jgi:LemA protein